MQVRLSQSLQAAQPDLLPILNDTLRESRYRDRDIKSRFLWVIGRCHWEADAFAGAAHPRRWSVTPYGIQSHCNGKVTLTIGKNCEPPEIARLFAHELRHIGQFHRGYDRFGQLTIETLTYDEAEDDAYEFEERIIDRMGLC